MSINTTTINRVIRVASEIAANAHNTSPGPWYMSHGHVISPGKNKKGTGHFDVCSQPWDEKQHVIEGLNPKDTGRNDMRHIATCEPKRMVQLTEDIGALLDERGDVTALACLLDDMINNTINGDADPRAKALGAAVDAYLSSAP